MAERPTFYVDIYRSPIGTNVMVADDTGALRLHHFGDDDVWRRSFEKRYGEATLAPGRDRFGFVAALAKYFDGDIAILDTLKVAFFGTPFQNKVWKALRKIPGGTTTSYGALAKAIGEPNAVRAVGLANGSNPVGLIVPCHRVIGSNGTLTGYGGGLPRKKWLLEHEARHAGAAHFRLEA
jgi:methylated-DNA-[protein]-cysteine S-methyltransferase